MPLTRSPMRDAIAMSMMQGTPGAPSGMPPGAPPGAPPGVPPISLAPPIARSPMGARPQPTMGARPPVFTGGGAITPTPQPIAPGVNAGQMAAQGVNAGYRYGRMARPPDPNDPFSQQNEPFTQYGVGGVY